MTDLIEVTLDENTKIYLEFNNTSSNCNEQFKPIGSASRVVEKAKDYFDDALLQIKTFSEYLARSVNDLSTSPSEIELGFSVKFSADAGIIISSISSEASITVKLKWSDSK